MYISSLYMTVFCVFVCTVEYIIMCKLPVYVCMYVHVCERVVVVKRLYKTSKSYLKN